MKNATKNTKRAAKAAAAKKPAVVNDKPTLSVKSAPPPALKKADAKWADGKERVIATQHAGGGIFVDIIETTPASEPAKPAGEHVKTKGEKAAETRFARKHAKGEITKGKAKADAKKAAKSDEPKPLRVHVNVTGQIEFLASISARIAGTKWMSVELDGKLVRFAPTTKKADDEHVSIHWRRPGKSSFICARDSAKLLGWDGTKPLDFVATPLADTAFEVKVA